MKQLYRGNGHGGDMSNMPVGHVRVRIHDYRTTSTPLVEPEYALDR